MKAVLQRTLHQKLHYLRLPFFQFLRDDTRPVVDRLAFFPCMAGFIMSFGDLNRYVLRDEPTDDEHQDMVNVHTHEDDHHWPWYLEDFEKLGFATPATPVQTLRFLYGEGRLQNRLLAHRLAHLVWSVSPTVRLAVVEAIEETGNVLFEATSRLAASYRATTGVELRYLGDFHFRRESGHAMHTDHAKLAAIQLDDATRSVALARVDQVFGWFRDWTDELLAFALEQIERRARTPSAAASRLQAS
ncbi:MAG: hypothetical protein JNL08_02375 [Planctomycetes bacterium]|nr:hypothetical protein [Planctomycetota bacterium]